MITRILLSLLLPFLFEGMVYSQSGFSLVDAKILGTPNSGAGVGAMSTDNDGNTYLMSNVASATGGDLNINYYGVVDVWLLKLDSDKNIVWQKGYGGDQVDLVNDIKVLPNGNLLLFIRSNSSPSGNRTAPLKGSRDVWMLEVDKTNGDIIQQRSIGGDGRTSYRDCKVKANGEVVLLCSIKASGTSNLDIEDPPLNAGTSDPWIAVLDNQWNIIQQKRLIQGEANGGSGGGVGTGTLSLSVDNVYIAVSSIGNSGGFKSDDSFDPDSSIPLSNDCWLIKLNWNFDVLWDKTFGGEFEDEVQGMVETEHGNLIVLMNSKSDIGGNKTSPRIGVGNNFNTWLIKVDESGNKTNDITYGSTGENRVFTKLHKLSENSFVFGGYVEPINDNDYINASFFGGSHDGFLMTVDQELNKKDLSVFGTPGFDIINSLVYSNGSVFTGGSSDYNGTSPYHPTAGYTGDDIWFLELSTSLNTTEEKFSNFSIYPNPVHQILTVKDTENQLQGISMYNLMGEKVFSKAQLNSSQIHQIDVQHFSSGVYFVQMNLKNGSSVRRKVVVQD